MQWSISYKIWFFFFIEVEHWFKMVTIVKDCRLFQINDKVDYCMLDAIIDYTTFLGAFFNKSSWKPF